MPILEAKGLFSDHPTAIQVSQAKVFEEPLVALGNPIDSQTKALAKSLDDYVGSGILEKTEALENYLATYPETPWKLSLLVNLGLVARHTGRVTQALAFWDEAWAFGKDYKDPLGVALANRALGELLEVNAGLGRPDRLEGLLAEARGRTLSGLVTEKMAGARESLNFMRATPYHAFQCGPLALGYIAALEDPMGFVKAGFLVNGGQGTSLSMNAHLAERLGLKLQMAKRTAGATFPVPSMVHFKTGHFSALLYQSGDKWLLQDPALGDTWVSSSTLEAETSGFALIPSDRLPLGWESVSEAEGNSIMGKGSWGPGRPDDTRPDSLKVPSNLQKCDPGVPHTAYHVNLVSLNLDIPAVDYLPILGPRVTLKVTYNQREYGQPQIFDYCNLGPKWTFSYLACIKDDTNNSLFNVSVCYPGGGGLVFQTKGDGTFKPEGSTQARLDRLSGGGYVIEYPEGRKEFYELSDRAWGLRRTVMTRIQDKFGREIQLTWDPMLRLKAITDAAGQRTSLTYGLDQDPLKITGVTDPFGRTTSFKFNGDGYLSEIVDCLGRTTRFIYGPTPSDTTLPQDFLNTLISPAGTLHFRAGETLEDGGFHRWIESVGEKAGVRERIEGGAGYELGNDSEQFPRIDEIDPNYYVRLHPNALSYREGYFWSAQVVGTGSFDNKKAMHFRWGHGPGGFSSGQVVSEKAATGSRHWFVHAGDFWGGACPAARKESYPLTWDGQLKLGKTLAGLTGTTEMAGQLAPMFDGDRDLITRDYWIQDGKMVRTSRDFNPSGHILAERLASGGTRTWAWDSRTGDLLAWKDIKDTKPHRFTYNDHHRLLSWTDPRGQVWTTSYDLQGRILSWGPQKGAEWIFHRDAKGRLDQVRHDGQIWSFSFDAMNRVHAITDRRGLSRTLTYDAWDRPTKALIRGGRTLEWRYTPTGNEERKGQGKPWQAASMPDGFLGLVPALSLPEGTSSPFASLLDGTDSLVLRSLLSTNGPSR
jgi:YD repeat-containing protein